MPVPKTYWWTKAPFMRIVISFIAGVLLQQCLHLNIHILLFSGLLLLIVVLAYLFLPLVQKFRFSVVTGLCINLLIVTLGALLTLNEDIRNHSDWFGHELKDNVVLLVSIHEPLVEKSVTYKSVAVVRSLIYDKKEFPVRGKIILYIKKEAAKDLMYGSRLAIVKPVQEVSNSGNPGAFDYRSYCLQQGITHQAYLTERDFTVLQGKDENRLKKFLIQSSSLITSILKKYIKDRSEAGLAEALLIGYKDDLDKNLVQAYSNTGVVHVIAISGLHLGLIYLMLLQVVKPLKRFKWTVGLRLLFILAGLWLFTLLTGAQPSILRSAVMFSCVALGETINRRSSIYNSLALSAFLLLCINPFWLWDIGFQLSYAAVLSIILFFPSVYNWLYFSNKILAYLWKLTAVTIAAQVLTIPISIYHFHQLPLIFILTNLVAVPLSSILLGGEIMLCLVAFAQPIASLMGTVVTYGIRFMNFYIERFNQIPGAVWNGLSITIIQTVLLYLFIGFIGLWLIEQRKRAFIIGLSVLPGFFILRSISFIRAGDQEKIIVYNTQHYRAIDLIEGRNSFFIGDTTLLQDELLYNFHLKPSRVINRIKTTTVIPSSSFFFNIKGKNIGVIGDDIFFRDIEPKKEVDLLVLSQNPHIYINSICKTFYIKQLIIDATVPAWKARLWKRDCDSLGIPCYNIAEKGAFVMNLQ